MNCVLSYFLVSCCFLRFWIRSCPCTVVTNQILERSVFLSIQTITRVGKKWIHAVSKCVKWMQTQNLNLACLFHFHVVDRQAMHPSKGVVLNWKVDSVSNVCFMHFTLCLFSLRVTIKWSWYKDKRKTLQEKIWKSPPHTFL